MESIYVFLIRNDVWIYILCSLGLIWYLSELWRGRRILRSAMFGLELEKGHRIQRRAITFIALFVTIIVVVTYVEFQIAPTLPSDLLKPPTPTPDIFATHLSSPTPLGPPAPAETATLAVAPTVTLPAPLGSDQSTPSIPDTSTVTPPIPTPAIQLGNCTPNINISAPPDGATASGRVTFFGSATDENFQSYDLVAFGPHTDQEWITLLEEATQAAIIDGILATVDLSNWTVGNYIFRLFVTGTTGDEVGQCAVQVSLTSPTS